MKMYVIYVLVGVVLLGARSQAADIQFDFGDWQGTAINWNLIPGYKSGNQQIQFDLGDMKGTAANWNLVSGPTTADDVMNAVDSTGGVTTVDFDIMDAFSGKTINSSSSGLYPNEVWQDSLYLTGTDSGIVVIRDLETDGTTYDFTFYAATQSLGSKLSDWTIGSATVQMNAENGNTHTVTIYDVTPDNAGTVTIDYTMGGADTAYWNAMVITVHNSEPSMGPNDITDAVDSTGGVTTVDLKIVNGFSGETQNTAYNGPYPDEVREDALYLIGNDFGIVEIQDLETDGTTYDFTFYAATYTAATGNKLTDWTIGNTTVQLNAALGNTDTVTIYDAKPDSAGTVTVNYAMGGTDTAYWNAMVIHPRPVPSPISQTIQFDLSDWHGTAPNWNVITGPLITDDVMNAVDSAGGATTVDFDIVEAFSTETQNTSTSGTYPNEVWQDSLPLTDADSGIVVIRDLELLGRTYDFTFYGATQSTGSKLSDWTIGDTTVQLNAANGNTNTVTIYGVEPDFDHTVTIDYTIGTGGDVAYWNAMVVVSVVPSRGTIIVIQ